MRQRILKRVLMRLGKPSLVLDERAKEKLNQHLLEAGFIIEATGDLTAGVSLLQKLDDVQAALKQGWSWSDIAEALGVSKQAAHRRLSAIIAGS